MSKWSCIKCGRDCEGEGSGVHDARRCRECMGEMAADLCHKLGLNEDGGGFDEFGLTLKWDDVESILDKYPKKEELTGCSECGRMYSSERKPRLDQRNYCQECRAIGIPDRNAKRRYRAFVEA